MLAIYKDLKPSCYESFYVKASIHLTLSYGSFLALGAT